MAAMTHTYARIVPPARSARDCVPDERASGDTANLEGREWPTDIQMWNWAGSAAFSGYGPSASSFL